MNPASDPRGSQHGAQSPLFRAHQNLARSVSSALAVFGLLTLTVPFLSYRNDVLVSETETVHRIQRAADSNAQALRIHLELLKAELLRLALRAEIDPMDSSTLGEQSLLDSAGRNSALFEDGIAVFSTGGQLILSEPAQLALGGADVLSRPWFQRLLSSDGPVAGLLEPQGTRCVVAVPIHRGPRTVGVLAGFFDALDRKVPGVSSPTEAGAELWVVDPAGNLLVPAARPANFSGPEFRAAMENLIKPSEVKLALNGQVHLGGAAEVSDGFVLAITRPRASIIEVLRRRFVGQLAILAALQGLVLTSFFVFLRRTYGSFRDMEARATAQERMAALGVASSLVAHEVKNAVNGLKSATSLLKLQDGVLPLRAIRGQTDRLRHLSESLFHFAQGQPVHRAELAFDDIVRQVLDALSVLPEWEEVELHRDIALGLTGNGDRSLLGAAFDNLVRNAVEAGVAAKDSGRQPNPKVEVTLTSDTSQVCFAVEDNAGGPPIDFEDRLFEPFSTSKAKGVGLGLVMARSAVEAHGGSLTFERIPGGSRFVARMPLMGAL